MESVLISETSVYLIEATRRYIPEAVSFILASVTTRNLKSIGNIMSFECRFSHLISETEFAGIWYWGFTIKIVERILTAVYIGPV
jgi:hypothetical protein